MYYVSTSQRHWRHVSCFTLDISVILFYAVQYKFKITFYSVEQQKFQIFLIISLSNAVCSEMESTHTVLQMCPETDVTARAKERPTDYNWLDPGSR